MKALSRVDDSAAARWWWSVDHGSLFILAALMTIGVVLVFAAGPGAAARFGIADDLHFPARQIMFAPLAVAVLLGASMLTPLQARRAGSIIFAAALVSLFAAALFAPEINGSRRWLEIGPLSFQPSELLKPGFVIVAAWMLAEGARDARFPGGAIATGLYLLCATLLALQPDYGQAALLTAVWMTMFFVSGGGLIWLVCVAAVAVIGLVAGYFLSPHLARRIDGFLNPEAGDNYQVDKALEAIASGGIIPKGGASSVKLSLPDAHTDFIFAVGVAEFGMALGLVILALFAAFVIRAYMKATGLKSVFAQSAVCGLAALIGLQSIIKIGVNLRALPAKGMTLPFISYGGSSLLTAALTVGLILALTRRQAHAARRKDVMP
ncbi:MAG: cell division protein FtsW [Parvularculaceae bacterium]|nr:cell division protein FtsW [Parvularculaceae bacterium]